jgi:MFS family permease
MQVQDAPAAPPISHGRAVFAAVLGNALEFYDFIVYSFFAIQIGHSFFPARSAYGSLMLSLATFGAGFLSRPVGALIIGRYADRSGRRPAMLISFALMGASVLGLALLPGYATLGAAAPILALTLRLIQGFAVGGEVGANTAFLAEAAPPARRAFTVSMQSLSQVVAMGVGALVGAILTRTLSDAGLQHYGWRIAIGLGAILLPVGLWLRRRLPETLHAAVAAPLAGRAGAPPPRAIRIFLLGAVCISAFTIRTYVVLYLVTYAQHTLRMPPGPFFTANVIGQFGSLLVIPAGALLADRIGRRPVFLSGQIVSLVVIYPVFAWVIGARSAAAVLIGLPLLTMTGSIAPSALLTSITEALPGRLRGTGFGLAYTLAVTLFGGTAQLVLTWLLHETGAAMAIAWYLLGAGLIGLAAMTAIPETRTP